MKLAYFLYLILLVLCFEACASRNNTMGQKQQIVEELKKINGLLRDTAFAKEMAMGQEASYYSKLGQPVPPFFPGPDSLIKKSLKEEKIAINLAGFYALECGIGALVQEKEKTPLFYLQQIVSKTVDSNDVLLLNRFANATWKAAQPFRSLDRITRDNFIIADFLSAEEIKKDEDQVIAAATILLDSLKMAGNESKIAQIEKIGQLLRDKKFAAEIAKDIEAAYYKGLEKPAPPFLAPGEDTAMIEKSANEEKIATNIAAFYALECGVSYLSNHQNKLPSDILKSINSDLIDVKDKQLLERFANATWKTGQPFRSLDRITRDIFMPFNLLPEVEIKKDWDQLTSAAKLVQKKLNWYQ